MADIDVVPKKRTNTWLWVILAVLAVLLVLWMMGMFAPETTGPVSQSIGIGPTATDAVTVSG
jgi:hypothetical protein